MHSLLKAMEARCFDSGDRRRRERDDRRRGLRHASIQLHEGLMKLDQNLTNVRIHLEIY